MTFKRKIYIVIVEGLSGTQSFRNLDDAFYYIRTIMPCKATIEAKEID